jgi:hypothetical protein
MRAIYDRVVDLVRYGVVTDQYGDEVAGWSPLAEGVPARRRLAPGSERLASSENAASAPVVFYIPWAPMYADLNPKDQVIHAGATLNIVSALEVGRQREIEIATIGRTDQ